MASSSDNSAKVSAVESVDNPRAESLQALSGASEALANEASSRIMITDGMHARLLAEIASRGSLSAPNLAKAIVDYEIANQKPTANANERDIYRIIARINKTAKRSHWERLNETLAALPFGKVISPSMREEMLAQIRARGNFGYKILAQLIATYESERNRKSVNLSKWTLKRVLDGSITFLPIEQWEILQEVVQSLPLKRVVSRKIITPSEREELRTKITARGDYGAKALFRHLKHYEKAHSRQSTTLTIKKIEKILAGTAQSIEIKEWKRLNEVIDSLAEVVGLRGRISITQPMYEDLLRKVAAKGILNSYRLYIAVVLYEEVQVKQGTGLTAAIIDNILKRKVASCDAIRWQRLHEVLNSLETKVTNNLDQVVKRIPDARISQNAHKTEKHSISDEYRTAANKIADRIIDVVIPSMFDALTSGWDDDVSAGMATAIADRIRLRLHDGIALNREIPLPSISVPPNQEEFSSTISDDLDKKTSNAQIIKVTSNRRLSLTKAQLVHWIEVTREATGKIPSHRDKSVWARNEDGNPYIVPNKTWNGIELDLRKGYGTVRSDGSKLPASLAEFKKDIGLIVHDLTKNQIEEWIVATLEKTGRFPDPKKKNQIVWGRNAKGEFEELRDETWKSIDSAIRNRGRGLIEDDGSAIALSLADLVQKLGLRKKRNPRLPINSKNDDYDNLSETQIVAWVFATREKTDRFPSRHDKVVWKKLADGSYEIVSNKSWGRIDAVLRRGLVQADVFPAATSLGELKRKYGITQHGQQEFQFSDAKSLLSDNAGETAQITSEISETGVSTNAEFDISDGTVLNGDRNLTESQVVGWIKATHEATGRIPTRHDKTVWQYSPTGQPEIVPGETWTALNPAIKNGKRGLVDKDGRPIAHSLAELKERHGLTDVKNDFTEGQIVDWLTATQEKTGKVPSVLDAAVWQKQPDGNYRLVKNETWNGIEHAIVNMHRGLVTEDGLPIAASFADFKIKHGFIDKGQLSEARIVEWLKATRDKNEGILPTKHDKPVWQYSSAGTLEIVGGETWTGINSAIKDKHRGLIREDGSAIATSLADLKRKRNLVTIKPAASNAQPSVAGEEINIAQIIRNANNEVSNPDRAEVVEAFDAGIDDILSQIESAMSEVTDLDALSASGDPFALIAAAIKQQLANEDETSSNLTPVEDNEVISPASSAKKTDAVSKGSKKGRPSVLLSSFSYLREEAPELLEALNRAGIVSRAQLVQAAAEKEISEYNISRFLKGHITENPGEFKLTKAAYAIAEIAMIPASVAFAKHHKVEETEEVSLTAESDEIEQTTDKAQNGPLVIGTKTQGNVIEPSSIAAQIASNLAGNAGVDNPNTTEILGPNYSLIFSAFSSAHFKEQDADGDSMQSLLTNAGWAFSRNDPIGLVGNLRKFTELFTHHTMLALNETYLNALKLPSEAHSSVLKIVKGYYQHCVMLEQSRDFYIKSDDRVVPFRNAMFEMSMALPDSFPREIPNLINEIFWVGNRIHYAVRERQRISPEQALQHAYDLARWFDKTFCQATNEPASNQKNDTTTISDQREAIKRPVVVEEKMSNDGVSSRTSNIASNKTELDLFGRVKLGRRRFVKLLLASPAIVTALQIHYANVAQSGNIGLEIDQDISRQAQKVAFELTLFSEDLKRFHEVQQYRGSSTDEENKAHEMAKHELSKLILRLMPPEKTFKELTNALGNVKEIDNQIFEIAHKAHIPATEVLAHYSGKEILGDWIDFLSNETRIDLDDLGVIHEQLVVMHEASGIPIFEEFRRVSERLYEEQRNVHAHTEDFIDENSALIANVSKEYIDSGLDEEKIEVEAIKALINAVETYSRESKIDFASYAQDEIRNAIDRELENPNSPLHSKDDKKHMLNELRRASTKIFNTTGQYATRTALAETLSIPLREVETLLELAAEETSVPANSGLNRRLGNERELSLAGPSTTEGLIKLGASTALLCSEAMDADQVDTFKQIIINLDSIDVCVAEIPGLVGRQAFQTLMNVDNFPSFEIVKKTLNTLNGMLQANPRAFEGWSYPVTRLQEFVDINNPAISSLAGKYMNVWEKITGIPTAKRPNDTNNSRVAADPNFKPK